MDIRDWIYAGFLFRRRVSAVGGEWTKMDKNLYDFTLIF